MFCTQPTAAPYHFRAPTKADFLDSLARERYLAPRYEIDLHKYWTDVEPAALLTRANIGLLEGWQRKSAVGHWAVIRTVVPAGVWENY